MNLRLVGWGLLALALAAGAASLGTWQLRRAAEKADFLARWQAGLAAPVRPMAEALDALDGPLAAPVRVSARGQYDGGATVLLDNQMLGGRPGVMVYTRFTPEGGTRAVLVNRGWLPVSGDRTLPAVASPSGTPIEVGGLLVAPPSAGLRLENPAWQRGASSSPMLWLDLDALRATMDPTLVDAVLLLDPDAALGFTRQWQPLPNTLPPERHRGYAVQWFGLSLAIVVTFLVLALRRRPR